MTTDKEWTTIITFEQRFAKKRRWAQFKEDLLNTMVWSGIFAITVGSWLGIAWILRELIL